MAGPDRGVATARVINDLVAGRTVEYWIQKGEVREVALLNGTRDSQSIDFGGQGWSHRSEGQ
jgi:hypothetical protein